MLSYKINRFIDEYRKINSVEPKISEIAKNFDVTEEEVVYAIDAVKLPVSIFESTNEDDTPLIDKIKGKDYEKEIDEKLILKKGINKLNDREKKIVLLRFYRDMTQGQIAEYFGLSQVQISRIEAKIMEKLKKEF